MAPDAIFAHPRLARISDHLDADRGDLAAGRSGSRRTARS
jgi:hypothetical protein